MSTIDPTAKSAATSAGATGTRILGAGHLILTQQP
jgi:hypothetical protein